MKIGFRLFVLLLPFGLFLFLLLHGVQRKRLIGIRHSLSAFFRKSSEDGGQIANRLILLYDTGARVQELADLDIESLHLDVPNPYISIIGKGRKRRNVPIMRKTVAHLNSYLKEFHPSEQSAPLFYSMRDGKPHRLSTDSISLVVGTAAKMARETCNAVPENVHCHLFRKTKAMDLYKNGIPLPFIMQLLGHESISTTSGFYAFATLEMMSDAINKSVPIIGGTEKLWKNKNAKQALYTLD